MFKKITETTAATGLGWPSSRKLFRINSGQHVGRILALIQTSSSEISFTYADKPYTAWYSPVVAADDAANVAFDAVMDAEGNAYLVYSEQSTYFLAVKRLTFSGGSWSVGDKVYVYNGGVSISPSVAADTGGTLWVSWAQLAAGYYDIRVKNSGDNGQTWGTGPADAGDAIRTGLSEGYSKVAVIPGNVYVIYTGTGTDILVRSQPLTGGGWSSEFTVASGTGIDNQFDVAVSGDGALGIVFDANQLRYREFDGSNWSSIVTLDENEVECPQLFFSGNVPVAVYISEPIAGQKSIRCTHRRTGVFSTAEILDRRAGILDSVVLYHEGSSTYADLTAAASSESTEDVLHPLSGSIIKQTGDAAYVGLDLPFRQVKFLLSTPGQGGTAAYSYFDGTNWKSFIPAGNGFNLDGAEKNLVLWEDLAGVPQDWQKCAVNDVSRYWMKVGVVSSYSTGPIGSQITAVCEVQAVSCRR